MYFKSCLLRDSGMENVPSVPDFPRWHRLRRVVAVDIEIEEIAFGKHFLVVERNPFFPVIHFLVVEKDGLELGADGVNLPMQT
jgi:hypothetical protein